MKYTHKYAYSEGVVEKFALFPVTLNDSRNMFKKTTVFMEWYKVRVKYVPSDSLLSFMISCDGGFTRPLREVEMYFV